MRQLVFRSADVYCQNLNNLNLRNIAIFILKLKKGKRASARRDRERQREEDQRRYIKIAKIEILFADAWRHLVMTTFHLHFP